MAPQPVVTGLSPKEGPPGTRVTIRGEFLGSKPSDLVGLTICGCDCLLSAEWKSPNKIIARTGPAKGKGDIIVVTLSGGQGTSTVQFRAYHETIGPMKESAVWIEESPMQSLAWGRRSLAPSGYTQEDPLGLSIEGNDKKLPEDLRDIFPEKSGDLSQDNFSPGWFLLEHHHATTFEDLKAGLSYLRRKVESQKEGQLSFLKSNAGSVIDQLDTLVSLREKFQQDVKTVGKDPVAKLDASIHKSITESHNLFNEVLTRREKADATRLALAALFRHKFLFCLPNSVVRSAEKEEYDIVINDYARAKKLFGKSDIPIFRRVIEEVDERILGVRKELHEKIVKMPQSVEQQKKFVKALVNLESQQVGTSVAEKLKIEDPAWDAIEARAKYLEETFKQTFEQHKGNPKPRDANAPPNRVAFCEEITEIAACQLPDLWRLGQAYFTGELRGIYEPKPGNFKRIILTAIEQMCFYLRAALLPSSSSGLKSTSSGGLNWPFTSQSSMNQFLQWLPNCLRYVRICYASLIRLDLPSEVLDIVQKLIDEIRLNCLATILKKSIDKVGNLSNKETWTMDVADFPGATLLPSLLEEIIKETLDECQMTCLTPEVRENELLEAHSEGQREMSQRLREMLDAFCGVIEDLALNRDDEESRRGPIISQVIGFPTSAAINGAVDDKFSVISWEQKILCCMANCTYCSKIFFGHIGDLFAKYEYPVPKLAIESSRTTANSLLSTLLDMYVEHKSDPLVGTIEPSMYISRFQWDTVSRVDRLRPYAYECIDNLAGVYSEILSIAPSLLRPILEPIVQTVAEELARLMTCVQKFSPSGTLQAYVDISLIRDALKLYSNATAKSHFTEALEVLPTLTDRDRAKGEEILQKVKQSMKLQLLCFSIANPI
ncbi:exocyst complex component 2 [Phlebotomus papatasi]|uniref:exocyst complex component 2 n=1 Tax=Phlebotomus papatasi TaxID=29031 RepID=UPI00248412D8|nr:exocyst complex component 2 [Phlebotomus papatasi]